MTILSVRWTRGYVVIEALTSAGAPSSTFAAAGQFVCVDGKTYWVKTRAQSGLAAEVVAGRLASKLSAGPLSRIIRVPAPYATGASHRAGVGAGSEDVPGAINARDIQTFFPGVGSLAGKLNQADLARVLVFQSWIGVKDEQVLIRLTDGGVFSIDHGACFADLSSTSAPTVVCAPVLGVPDADRKDPSATRNAVQRIEVLTEQDLLEAVSCIPDDDDWKASAGRRLSVATWLRRRQGQIRGVMESWLRA